MITLNVQLLCLRDARSLIGGSMAHSQLNCADYLLPSVVLQAALDAHSRGIDWFWCAPRLFVDDTTGQTMGTASFIATDDADVVEIGYGTANEFQGLGVASRGIAQMLAQAQAYNCAKSYIAKTASGNLASQRVLEKNGFAPCCKIIDPEDGEIVLWSKKKGAVADLMPGRDI
ncbi:MAG: N-acetyltransferase [Deltaproteobacteria bacterium]|nr:N-acetyltransferase [Deltaproteobacteria bacterium]